MKYFVLFGDFPEAEFLDEIQTKVSKVLRVFLLAIFTVTSIALP
jgi:hypothetical protein